MSLDKVFRLSRQRRLDGGAHPYYVQVSRTLPSALWRERTVEGRYIDDVLGNMRATLRKIWDFHGNKRAAVCYHANMPLEQLTTIDGGGQLLSVDEAITKLSER